MHAIREFGCPGSVLIQRALERSLILKFNFLGLE